MGNPETGRTGEIGGFYTKVLAPAKARCTFRIGRPAEIDGLGPAVLLIISDPRHVDIATGINGQLGAIDDVLGEIVK